VQGQPARAELLPGLTLGKGRLRRFFQCGRHSRGEYDIPG
jgi:hypothetical protein